MAREVQALGRGLDILGILADAEEPLGVTELARTLGVDKSSASRLLSTLASRGFVERDDATRRYSLGLRVIDLSRRVLDRIELRSVAKPLLRRLVKQVGEAAHLAMFVADDAVYVDSVASGASLNVHTEIGERAPLHCTAIGKSLVAYLPTEDLEVLLERAGLKEYTPRTITTMREILPHLESVRERGYAVDDEEFDPGVRCVAAPVRDHRNKVIASVGVSGPTIRVTLDRIPRIGRIVVETAAEISRRLGWCE